MNRSHARQRRHRGVSSLLAMIYLVLFAGLAIGFYATTSTAVQVSGNDRNGSMALAAAGTGMDFMRYQLARISIPPGTTLENTRSELFDDLKNLLNDTWNLRGRVISMTGNTIAIPADPDRYIWLDASGNQAFRASITEWAGEIVVKVTGRYTNPQATASGNQTYRTITMDFTRQSRPATAFNYAVASRGKVVITRGGILSADPNNPTLANVMSATTSTPSIKMDGGTVGGDLNIVSGGSADITSGTVNGTSVVAAIYRDHVLTVPPPEFPVADTAYYKPYATNTYSAGAKVQQNIRIPAGTNPQFSGGDTVQGIMYIESPNTVTFRGNFNLQGFIIFEQSNNSAVNGLDFRGSVIQSPLPSGSQFDPLRVTTGVSILAPTALLTMSGSSDSFLIGNVMVDKFNYTGAANVTVDRGTMMTFNEGANSAYFSGKNLNFTGIGANNLPTTGLNLAAYYIPKPSSYQEVLP